MSLLRAPLCVVDTETSGFISNRLASVIDVGAVLLDVDGNEIAHFSTLVQPIAWGDWAADAVKIHGITFDKLNGAPKPSAVVADLLTWLEQHGEPTCTTFNTGFDVPMLRRMGLDIPFGPCLMIAAAKVMGKAGVLRPGDPGHPRFDASFPWLFPPLRPKEGSGVSACEFFGVAPVEPAHRALSDAQTAGRVLVALLKRSR